MAMTQNADAHGNIYIGISGWRYKGWRGAFYPEKLPHGRELEFASQRFNTIELNGSFYSLQRPGALPNGANKRRNTSSFLSKAPDT
jgi:uncharacterized protein YecE (DUF72 family)